MCVLDRFEPFEQRPPISLFEQHEPLPGPLLSVFGGADTSIPLDEVRAFEQALQPSPHTRGAEFAALFGAERAMHMWVCDLTVRT